jgi:tetratricopeptide (TPR) repeat protein
VSLAIPEFEAALRTNPRNAVAWENLGGAKAVIGQMDDALSCFLKGLELRPDNQGVRTKYARLQIMIGDAFIRRGFPEQARVRCLDALRIDPGNDVARNYIQAHRSAVKKE